MFFSQHVASAQRNALFIIKRSKRRSSKEKEYLIGPVELSACYAHNSFLGHPVSGPSIQARLAYMCAKNCGGGSELSEIL